MNRPLAMEQPPRTVSEDTLVRCHCGQALARRIAQHTYEPIGADAVRTDGQGRLVFTCAVCGRVRRASRGGAVDEGHQAA